MATSSVRSLSGVALAASIADVRRAVSVVCVCLSSASGCRCGCVSDGHVSRLCQHQSVAQCHARRWWQIWQNGTINSAHSTHACADGHNTHLHVCTCTHSLTSIVLLLLLLFICDVCVLGRFDRRRLRGRVRGRTVLCGPSSAHSRSCGGRPVGTNRTHAASNCTSSAHQDSHQENQKGTSKKRKHVNVQPRTCKSASAAHAHAHANRRLSLFKFVLSQDMNESV